VRVGADRSLSFWLKVLRLTPSGAHARHDGAVEYWRTVILRPSSTTSSSGTLVLVSLLSLAMMATACNMRHYH